MLKSYPVGCGDASGSLIVKNSLAIPAQRPVFTRLQVAVVWNEGTKFGQAQSRGSRFLYWD